MKDSDIELGDILRVSINYNNYIGYVKGVEKYFHGSYRYQVNIFYSYDNTTNTHMEREVTLYIDNITKLVKSNLYYRDDVCNVCPYRDDCDLRSSNRYNECDIISNFGGKRFLIKKDKLGLDDIVEYGGNKGKKYKIVGKYLGDYNYIINTRTNSPKLIITRAISFYGPEIMCLGSILNLEYTLDPISLSYRGCYFLIKDIDYNDTSDFIDYNSIGKTFRLCSSKEIKLIESNNKNNLSDICNFCIYSKERCLKCNLS